MGQISSLQQKVESQQTESMDVKYNQTHPDSRQVYIASKFHFTLLELNSLRKIFTNIDVNKQGAITLENLFSFLKEELISIISPYLLYLFQLIEKEDDNQITFVELIPTMSAFCLYSHEQILSFVFQMLDQDHDNCISKKDIMKFLVSERFNSKIFPFNYVKAVELMELERPDKITFEAFIKIQKEVPFICYPAFRLQQSLKKKFHGDLFWFSVGERIANRENEENKLKQLDRIKEEVRKKQQIKIDQKIEKFVQITQDQTIPREFIKKNRKNRTKERSNSEYLVQAFCQPPDQLIDEVYQSHVSKFVGTLWYAQEQAKNENQDITSLHWGSRSETYIRKPIKMALNSRRNGQSITLVQNLVPVQILASSQRAPRRSIFKDFQKSRNQDGIPADDSFESSISSRME